jgi:hypothetical protein
MRASCRKTGSWVFCRRLESFLTEVTAVRNCTDAPPEPPLPHYPCPRPAQLGARTRLHHFLCDCDSVSQLPLAATEVISRDFTEYGVQARRIVNIVALVQVSTLSKLEGITEQPGFLEEHWTGPRPRCMHNLAPFPVGSSSNRIRRPTARHWAARF